MTGIDDHGLGNWGGKEKGKMTKSYTSALFWFCGVFWGVF